MNDLTEAERGHILTSERFVDKSVAQVTATLLDEGTYLCSQSTMHRILCARTVLLENAVHRQPTRYRLASVPCPDPRTLDSSFDR